MRRVGQGAGFCACTTCCASWSYRRFLTNDKRKQWRRFRIGVTAFFFSCARGRQSLLSFFEYALFLSTSPAVADTCLPILLLRHCHTGTEDAVDRKPSVSWNARPVYESERSPPLQKSTTFSRFSIVFAQNSTCLAQLFSTFLYCCPLNFKTPQFPYPQCPSIGVADFFLEK